jgi:hypothetical protein
VVESYGLDVDKKSHLRLLMLTKGMAWDSQQGCFDLNIALGAKNNRISH